MQTASLGQYGNLDFVFLDLKQKSATLDKETSKDLKKLEKLIIKSFSSRKKLDTELDLIYPQLFSLRLKGLEYLSEEKQDINKALDEVYPAIEVLGKNPRLKKTGYHIAQALSYNRKLVNFFEDTGLVNEKTISSIVESDIDYSSYLVALKLMPTNISKLFMGLMNASLQIEFISIASIMLNNKEFTCSDLKIAQLTSLASNTSIAYMGYVNHLITMAQAELFIDEKNEWNSVSLKAYANAYSDNEPDYDNIVLREPNPEYNK